MNNSFLKINQNITAALSYVLGPASGLICYIGEGITGSNNKYVMFHSLQSIIFFGVAYIIQFALGIIGFLPFMGLIISIFKLFTVAAWLYLMFIAYSGREFKIPMIGDVCFKTVNK